MRTFSYLCLLIVLFCGGLSVNAAIKECRNVTTVETPVPQLLKLLSCDQQLKHNGCTPLPEIIVSASQQSLIISFKSDTRDGAGTAREYFSGRVNIFFYKVQATRLLPDLHAIINLLIFPKHFFW
jgi:hypothetical protein